MANKEKLIFIFALLTLTLSAFGKMKVITFSGHGKSFKFHKTSDGTHEAITCKKCESQKLFNSNFVDLKKIVDAKNYKELSFPTQLCLNLEGLVWIVQDQTKNDFSICELKDKSYFITEELAQYYLKLEKANAPTP